MRKWNLDPLFPGFESEEFKSTIDTIKSQIETSKKFALSLDEKTDTLEVLKAYVQLASDIRHNLSKAYSYVNLVNATNAQDETANAWMNTMQSLASELTPFNTKFIQWIANVEDLESYLDQDPVLEEHRFHLSKLKENAKYVLSEEEETVISKMQQTGSNAWSQLQGLLTSILEVEYEGEKITLPDVRNKAHSRDKDVRKKAYEAELKAYEKIEHSIAFALNSIKGEVNELTKMRGFESPLHQAVHDSRMKKETLDTLIETMRENLPMFRAYLKRKGKLLGHENGLPWYDLFAPLGKSERTFDEDEAMDYVIENFKSFGDDLANLAKRAKEESWIDFTPRSGKRGGAFCANLHPIKQSRILTNFEGSFSNVITLSHELGHAYHGDRIFDETILNASYTMPVAETASTLCETIVKRSAIEESEGQEKLFILEQSVMGATQVIVDILSRFIFEKSVFETRDKRPISVPQLKKLMTDAQKEAYGDGLDQETLHPYMWVNKPHYYRGSLSFYNFPYAFGLLFAKGIYAYFKDEGKDAVPKIDHLLRKTGQMDVEEVAALLDIDVTDKAFWQRSFDVIKEEIDEFLELTEDM
ncbi:MAG: M3 family oligoendopeptidase [Candidatus Izemoplasmataceae bacterium]